MKKGSATDHAYEVKRKTRRKNLRHDALLVKIKRRKLLKLAKKEKK